METDLLSISLASVDLDASAIGTREIGANVERESSESEIALLGHFEFDFPCFVPSPCHAAVAVGDALLHFATLCTSVTTLHFV